MVTKPDALALLEDGPEQASQLAESGETHIGGRPADVPGEPCRRSRRDGREVEFEVIWNGIGPLPGGGGASGLGSTLSGIHFSIGRRV
jgi:hypothetical protein